MATPYELVASDPALRRMLEVARAWGVRPSVVTGEPVVTMHVYDPGGRMVSSTEPGWSMDETGLAMALLDYEAGLCKGCGHPLEETTAPDAEEGYDVGVSARCHCCTALDIAQDAVQDRPHPSALLLSAVRRTPDEYRNQGDHEADLHP